MPNLAHGTELVYGMNQCMQIQKFLGHKEFRQLPIQILRDHGLGVSPQWEEGIKSSSVLGQAPQPAHPCSSSIKLSAKEAQ